MRDGKPGEGANTGAEEFRPSFRYRQSSPPYGYGIRHSPEGPIFEAEIRGDSRVRFWIIGPDGKARRGEYVPGLGLREIAH